MDVLYLFFQVEDDMQTAEGLKTSRYLEAGSPLTCFLRSCGKPFMGTCIHADDDHFYCSHECAEEGQKVDLANVEQLKPRKKA